jgi:hypothetical protein
VVLVIVVMVVMVIVARFMGLDSGDLTWPPYPLSEPYHPSPTIFNIQDRRMG